jgi:uncharacterized membrane protein HdeD (DUF308 family)
MIMVLARNWWVLALRGLASIVFGLAAFVLPGVTLAVMVLLFGAYALIEGILAIVAGIRAAERHERWWPMVLEGVAGVLAGVLTFVWPAITAVILLYLIAFWALTTGILKIVSAVRVRRHVSGEWLHGLNGLVSVLFGLVLLIVPGLGLLVIVWWIAAYAVVRGVLATVLAFRLRRHLRQAPPAKAA